jgi:hypothetical protein
MNNDQPAKHDGGCSMFPLFFLNIHSSEVNAQMIDHDRLDISFSAKEKREYNKAQLNPFNGENNNNNNNNKNDDDNV